MIYQENRSNNKRFEQDIKNMRNRSIVSDIIDDKLDKFWVNTQKRLVELDEESLNEETIVEIETTKKDFKAAIANHFDNSIIVSCMTLLHDRNAWNEFQRDNYQRMKEAWKEMNPGKGKYIHGYSENRISIWRLK